jgi:hypothetical protein
VTEFSITVEVFVNDACLLRLNAATLMGRVEVAALVGIDLIF